jgi:hypothetical protein
LTFSNVGNLAYVYIASIALRFKTLIVAEYVVLFKQGKSKQ